ncbi:hypothetical protein ACFQ0M_02105 [Kitasatospora aburaviensis]
MAGTPVVPNVRRVDGTALLGLAADVRDVYALAFGRPPWNEPAALADDYLSRLRRDVGRPGFTAAAALRTDGRLVGFATAWTTPEPFLRRLLPPRRRRPR